MSWLSKIVPGHAPDGAPVLSVLGKRTYKIQNGKKAIPDDDNSVPLYEADQYGPEGTAETSIPIHESDLIAYKPMTDVIVTGKAHSPKGKRAFFLDISIQVGSAKKVIRVTGDRRVYITATGIAFTNPEPFESIPMDYALAYGGRDKVSVPGTEYVYPRNPFGKGFITSSIPAVLHYLPLPNIESPDNLLKPDNLIVSGFNKWLQQPEPAGFGSTGRNFYPRYTLAGLPPDSFTENEITRQQQIMAMPSIGTPGLPMPAPSTPMINPQFYNCASSGLMFPNLNGNEPITLIYMDADFPEFKFELPGQRPSAWLDVGEGPEDMDMVLHTVEINKEQNQLAMVWRGSAYYGGPEAMGDFERLEFGVEESKK